MGYVKAAADGVKKVRLILRLSVTIETPEKASVIIIAIKSQQHAATKSVHGDETSRETRRWRRCVAACFIAEI
jgi:hypothetical protein